MISRVYFYCPYCDCQMSSELVIDAPCKETKVITCSTEDGGCERRFVVDLELKITANTFKILNDEAK